MLPRPEHTIRRKMSNMSILGLSRSTSAATANDSRSSTPISKTDSTSQSSRRRKSGGLRQLLDRHRVQEPNFEMVTSPSQASQSVSSAPQISKLAKAFVDSLNGRQLSEFLIWMLYHEVIELPDHPDIWYNLIDPVDMRGWIALGDFLLNFSTTMNTGYGFDIVVLDSICDRLELQRSTVHGLLMHFADPAKMAFSQIATLIDAANKERLPEIEVLKIAQSKLREFSRLVARLTPTEASIYDDWHAVLLKRLYSLLHLVIAPRIASFRFDVPLLTAATSEELPQEVKDGIRLNYLFELVQQKRQVPLSRYGTHTGSVSLGSTTPPSSPPDEHGNSLPNLDDTERVRSHAIWLVGRNQELCSQVASLQLDKENLQDSNEKLARKVAVLGRVQQPTTYSQPPAEVGSRPHHTSSSDTDDHEQEPNYLQIPSSHNPRHRSLSQDTGPKLATELNQKLHMSNHIRQRSDILTWRYEDVFEPLDSPPSSPLRLSDPATGELLQPMTSSLAAGDGRCSGVAFSADQTELLRDIQDGTPSLPRDSSDGEGDEEEDGLGTPTSSGR